MEAKSPLLFMSEGDTLSGSGGCAVFVLSGYIIVQGTVR